MLGGVGFEHYLTCEWDIHAVASCKAIHFGKDNIDYSADYSEDELIDILFSMGISVNGKNALTREQISKHQNRSKWLRETYNNIKATHNLVNIMEVKGSDLSIVDTDKYIYLLTYSFPCQDLSLAGKRRGMAKGGGTRSGLLWEVERLLNEVEHLPQILLMENVPQVVSKENISDFQSWMRFLESKGYKNYGEILNAKDYGVPQNRERYFMVSVLGEYNYKFPKPIDLTSTMKDYLEPKVAPNYYIDTPKALSLIENFINSGQLENRETSNTVRGQRISRPSSMGFGGGESLMPIRMNYNRVDSINDNTAKTIIARDYKGFGTSFETQNGVIDEQSD